MNENNNMSWNILNLNSNPASGEPTMDSIFMKSNGHDIKTMPKPRSKFTVSSMLMNEAAAYPAPTNEKDDVNVPLPSLKRDCQYFQKIEKKRTRSKETLDKCKGLNQSHIRLHEVSKASEEMNNNLTHENNELLEKLEDSRRNSVGLKVSAAFAWEGFRGQRRLSQEFKEAKQKKVEEAAARMILHNLLLNSWRSCKEELDSLMEDNSQLNKAVRAFSLK
jgi:hypothetical protein